MVIGEGERRRRYVACYNPEEATRQRRHREQVLAELAAELESLRYQPGDGHSKRVCELRASGRYGRYLRVSRGGKPAIDQARVKEIARLDGKFVVHSNDDTLNAEDMALGYKQLQRVEEAWRTLKSGLKLRARVSLGATPHSRARGADRPRVAARAHGGAGVRRHLAQHPQRPQADQTRSIVEPERHRLAGHGAGSERG
ncbi:MAG TPA: hypothetical protein VE553_01660 [Candidatus Binatia bacterium]|nr:hypothetical protein [Candidatus Binatia bacterium]